MQIEERAVGDVVILDLKGKITLGEGDELHKGSDHPNGLNNAPRSERHGRQANRYSSPSHSRRPC